MSDAKLAVEQWRNPVYNAVGTIDCEINHPKLGWIPFTASPDDVEEHGVAIYNDIVASPAGTIQPYVPPTIEEQRRRMDGLTQKQMRFGLLAKNISMQDLMTAIEQVPESGREAARIEFQYTDVFYRLNPSVKAVLKLLGFTARGIDRFWAGALLIQ